MKKIIALILIVIMLFSFSVSFADDNDILYGCWTYKGRNKYNTLMISPEKYILLTYYYPGNDSRLISGTIEYVKLIKDGIDNNTFYLVLDNANVIKLIVSEDGKSLQYGFINDSESIKMDKVE